MFKIAKCFLQFLPVTNRAVIFERIAIIWISDVDRRVGGIAVCEQRLLICRRFAFYHKIYLLNHSFSKHSKQFHGGIAFAEIIVLSKPDVDGLVSMVSIPKVKKKKITCL
jgi:hypothetical protein